MSQTLGDLRRVGVQILTIGQYLRPTQSHLRMVRYYHPDEFAALKRIALDLGFGHVESGPLVRSSYHAHEQADALAAARAAELIVLPRPAPSPALLAVHQAIVTCERCPRLRAPLPADRDGQEGRVSRSDLLGPAGARLRRSGRARAAHRPRAGRARRQPHGTRVHRRRGRRVGRLPDAGTARQRPRIAADFARPRRWPRS